MARARYTRTETLNWWCHLLSLLNPCHQPRQLRPPHRRNPLQQLRHPSFLLFRPFLPKQQIPKRLLPFPLASRRRESQRRLHLQRRLHPRQEPPVKEKKAAASTKAKELGQTESQSLQRTTPEIHQESCDKAEEKVGFGGYRILHPRLSHSGTSFRLGGARAGSQFCG